MTAAVRANHCEPAPPGHVAAPVLVGSTKVPVHLGVQLGLLHLVGRVALEDRAGTDLPAVALEIALIAVGTDRLEIRPERPSRELGEPVLELGALLLQKGHVELHAVERRLHFIHCFSSSSRHADVGRRQDSEPCRWAKCLRTLLCR